MTIIEDIVIRKIMDSRGRPTVEVEVYTPDGVGVAAAPSGASTGEHEVVAFPEKGVDAAIEQFRKIVIPELLDLDSVDQRYIDRLLHELDGTPNFSKRGGNLTVATSLAVAKAAADSLCMPLYAYLGGTFAHKLPYPMGNVIGGGAHAVGGTDIQEYLAVSTSNSASKNVFTNAIVHKRIKDKLAKKFPGEAIGKGDEGA
ncbi:MAG: enolase, partial [Thermoplasmata archaeon]